MSYNQRDKFRNDGARFSRYNRGPTQPRNSRYRNEQTPSKSAGQPHQHRPYSPIENPKPIDDVLGKVSLVAIVHEAVIQGGYICWLKQLLENPNVELVLLCRDHRAYRNAKALLGSRDLINFPFDTLSDQKLVNQEAFDMSIQTFAKPHSHMVTLLPPEHGVGVHPVYIDTLVTTGWRLTMLKTLVDEITRDPRPDLSVSKLIQCLERRRGVMYIEEIVRGTPAVDMVSLLTGKTVDQPTKLTTLRFYPSIGHNTRLITDTETMSAIDTEKECILVSGYDAATVEYMAQVVRANLTVSSSQHPDRQKFLLVVTTNPDAAQNRATCRLREGIEWGYVDGLLSATTKVPQDS